MTATKYRRICDYCGHPYYGYGAKYCSQFCSLQAIGASVDNINPKEVKTEVSHSPNRTHVTIEGKRVLTLDDLLEICNVDLDLWSVIRYKCNKWEQGAKGPDGGVAVTQLFQVKADLEPIKAAVDAQAICELFIAKANDHSPTSYRDLPARPINPHRGERNLYEINITDHHVGKLCYGLETMGANYDTKIAVNDFLWAVEDLIEKAAHYDIDKFLFPVGNDLFHADRPVMGGSGGMTTRGTIVDVDSRRKKLLKAVNDMCITAIDRMLEVANVDVVIVPGNHDEDSAFTLGMNLTSWYRHTDRVDVDNAEPLRKYYEYGKVLLGFTHGYHEPLTRLPMLMPLEAPLQWGRTKYREWHTGDKHRKKVLNSVSVDEETGMRIRIFPSLSPSGAWDAERGYGNVRAAEGIIWGHETGFKTLNSSNAR